MFDTSSRITCCRYADIEHLVSSNTIVLVAAFESDDIEVVRNAAAGWVIGLPDIGYATPTSVL